MFIKIYVRHRSVIFYLFHVIKNRLAPKVYLIVEYHNYLQGKLSWQFESITLEEYYKQEKYNLQYYPRISHRTYLYICDVNLKLIGDTE